MRETRLSSAVREIADLSESKRAPGDAMQTCSEGRDAQRRQHLDVRALLLQLLLQLAAGGHRPSAVRLRLGLSRLRRTHLPARAAGCAVRHGCRRVTDPPRAALRVGNLDSVDRNEQDFPSSLYCPSQRQLWFLKTGCIWNASYSTSITCRSISSSTTWHFKMPSRRRRGLAGPLPGA